MKCARGFNSVYQLLYKNMKLYNRALDERVELKGEVVMDGQKVLKNNFFFVDQDDHMREDLTKKFEGLDKRYGKLKCNGRAVKLAVSHLKERHPEEYERANRYKQLANIKIRQLTPGFWKTYNHWYDWIKLHYEFWEQGIEIRGKPSFNDSGGISEVFFFDPKKKDYRGDLTDRFKKLTNGPVKPSKLARVCFSLRHPVMQFIANYYLANQMWEKRKK